MDGISFGSQAKLVQRLKNAINKKQKITIICGSGMTLGNSASPGVSSTSDIVKSIISKFEPNTQLIDEELLMAKNVADSYQIAMKTLLECEGQDELNKIIQEAVLQARIDKKSIFSNQEISLESIEKDYANWNRNEALAALAHLYQKNPESFNQVILTTNFDPLIEVALNSAGIISETKILNTDGKIFDTVRHSNIVSVVHLHGFWRGSDTLHTVKQITRTRPMLKGALREVFSNSIVLVIGYSGWEDVFTKTLIEVINEDGTGINVLWTFYNDDDKVICQEQQKLLERLEDSLEQRVVLYKGIDCHKLFPALVDEVGIRLVEKNNELPEVSIMETALAKASTRVQVEGRKNVFSCDNPVVNYTWTGRSREMSEINNPSKNVVYISGIGGQGKSGIAARYLQEYVTDDSIWEFWDWRDCKEEANRIHSKVLSIIERVSDGQYRSYQLIDSRFEDLVDLFFTLLQDRRVVFVFDNVDYYVDIVKFNLIGPVGYLFEKALIVNHLCKFIFTGRPVIENIRPNFLSLRLQGLSIEETKGVHFPKFRPFKSRILDRAQRGY